MMKIIASLKSDGYFYCTEDGIEGHFLLKPPFESSLIEHFDGNLDELRLYRMMEHGYDLMERQFGSIDDLIIFAKEEYINGYVGSHEANDDLLLNADKDVLDYYRELVSSGELTFEQNERLKEQLRRADEMKI